MLMTADIRGHLEQMLGQAIEPAVTFEETTPWCMVLVRSGYEQEARDSLRRRGVGCWWPNYPKSIGQQEPRKGRWLKRTIFIPVLPGVLLAPARFSSRFWKAIDEAPGVINIARKFNTDVVLLSDLDIALIHKIEEGLNRGDKPKSDHSYKAGEMVRLIDDEYRRLPQGKIIRCLKGEAVEIEINIMGAVRPMKVLASQIEPVDPMARISAKGRSTDARERPAKSRPAA